ncbi:hypothetical protein GCM10027035_49350 [Emticicia sediminis]
MESQDLAEKPLKIYSWEVFFILAKPYYLTYYYSNRVYPKESINENKNSYIFSTPNLS